MICPNCQTPNPANAKFCIECGQPLPRICAVCGASNPPGARFCNQCGAPQPTAAEGSRTFQETTSNEQGQAERAMEALNATPPRAGSPRRAADATATAQAASAPATTPYAGNGGDASEEHAEERRVVSILFPMSPARLRWPTGWTPKTCARCSAGSSRR